MVIDKAVYEYLMAEFKKDTKRMFERSRSMTMDMIKDFGYAESNVVKVYHRTYQARLLPWDIKQGKLIFALYLDELVYDADGNRIDDLGGSRRKIDSFDSEEDIINGISELYLQLLDVD